MNCDVLVMSVVQEVDEVWPPPQRPEVASHVDVPQVVLQLQQRVVHL